MPPNSGEHSPAIPPPPVLPRRPRHGGDRSSDRWIQGFVLVLAVLALALLWRFPPQGQSFYPTCQLYQVTGLMCPGCGGLRATHALLNGNIGMAWRLNPLLVVSLPLIAWSLVAWSANYWQRARKLWNPLGTPVAIALWVGIAFGFGLARNLPLAQWLGWGQ